LSGKKPPVDCIHWHSGSLLRIRSSAITPNILTKTSPSLIPAREIHSGSSRIVSRDKYTAAPSLVASVFAGKTNCMPRLVDSGVSADPSQERVQGLVRHDFVDSNRHIGDNATLATVAGRPGIGSDGRKGAKAGFRLFDPMDRAAGAETAPATGDAISAGRRSATFTTRRVKSMSVLFVLSSFFRPFRLLP
jgi:hypothetical protein